jgi:hypothetical protein
MHSSVPTESLRTERLSICSSKETCGELNTTEKRQVKINDLVVLVTNIDMVKLFRISLF